MTNDELVKLVVNVPETSVGEVMGELNRRGAWLDNMTSKGGFCIVETRVPKQEVQGFETWLKKTANGKIQIMKDQ